MNAFEKTETRKRTVQVPAGSVLLQASLEVPAAMASKGVVLFAHGSGSSRFSPRNRYVAQVLRSAGLATMLLDLLTKEEELIDDRTRHLRFDISLLAHRLSGAIDWLKTDPSTSALAIGLFGASTGAAAALVAAAQRPEAVAAVVSRGGRPDLAGAALAAVLAPTLMIVGALDETVIRLNKQARRLMHGSTSLEIIPDATHLFEEPGTLEQVAVLARDWFIRHLAATGDQAMMPHLAGGMHGERPGDQGRSTRTVNREAP